jgi:arginine utilization protein RocB
MKKVLSISMSSQKLMEMVEQILQTPGGQTIESAVKKWEEALQKTANSDYVQVIVDRVQECVEEMNRAGITDDKIETIGPLEGFVKNKELDNPARSHELLEWKYQVLVHLEGIVQDTPLGMASLFQKLSLNESPNGRKAPQDKMREDRDPRKRLAQRQKNHVKHRHERFVELLNQRRGVQSGDEVTEYDGIS